MVSMGSLLSAQPAADGIQFFENKIRPVLAKHCYECHSEGAKKVKGDLKLDTKEDFLRGGIEGAIVKPGDPEASRFIKAVRHDDPDLAMPNGGQKLPAPVIADLVQWVKMGAPYPETPANRRRAAVKPWAFEPIQESAPPPVKDQAWPVTSIDPFILAKIEARGWRPSPRADQRTLLRRVTFDLTGLPPTPEEMDGFLADSATDAFARVVERLLASPRYGEHWGRHWLDVVRYADTAGDTADYPLPEAWKYRNYVIDSLNADKPYDEFIREQIAGDILAKEGPREKYAERVTATGYLALSRRFGFDSENYHHLTIQDTIDTLGQSVLGLTLGCARCHDHKFDPVSARDYYGLFGIFESTRYPFPGSEQKGRYRAMMPLVPPGESQTKWRELQASFVSQGVSPSSVLRSLDDMDGDFEMQAVAGGGSYGVLVPPWFYEGKVSVSKAAQSPYKNLHPFGAVGASVASASTNYSIWQTIHPARTHGIVHVNLDFRAATNTPSARGQHRFAVGSQHGSPAVEVLISPSSLTMVTGGDSVTIPFPKPGHWQNLQLTIDLQSRTFSGAIGVPGSVIAITRRSLAADWNGVVNTATIASVRGSQEPLPGLEIDNVGLQDLPVAPASTQPTVPTAPEAGLAALQKELAGLNGSLQKELAQLSGIDGDLEMQNDGQPPSAPWHPGPNSTVKIMTAAQSPFRNHYPIGRLGLRLPGSSVYNGLGLHLPKPWTAETAPTLHLGLDFRCGNEAAGGEGTWRFHLGHGPGSAAIELGFNRGEFYRRSGNARDRVAELRPGEWHQVQIILNLKDRKYTGTVGTKEGLTAFAGDFTAGWDGTINYAFIDSGGHINGAKPVLDADNFVLGMKPLPPLEAPEVELAGGDRAERLARQSKIVELRGRIDKLTKENTRRQEALNARLATGPVALAYAVSEGTPHHARIQIRGEPEKPGPEVPRGFPSAFGGGSLPAASTGSGRLELAQWLTQQDNPLTARVMANRVWQYHFGRALVRTPNDFGNRSEPPTHPELLDHLARKFLQSGWSLKALHRLIVLSATYRQSAVTSDPYSVSNGKGTTGPRMTDLPLTDYFSSFPRQRLSAEEIRDSILSVSGTLDITPGLGHPFPAANAWGFSQHAPFNAVYEHNRRSVYLMVQRIKRHPFLALFDGADPNASTAERRITTVPTQALYFLNDPFVHAQSVKCAERLTQTATDEKAQVVLAIRLAFGRSPGDEEVADATDFLAGYRAGLTAAGKKNPAVGALAAYVRTLFGSNEFLHRD